MSPSYTIIPAHEPAYVPTVRALFEEYGASLGFHLCFQSFDEELRTLPGKYAPPAGRIFLAVTPAQNPDRKGVGLQNPDRKGVGFQNPDRKGVGLQNPDRKGVGDDGANPRPDLPPRRRGRNPAADEEGDAIACIALRPLDSSVCEMKRMYVKPAYRNWGLGRALAERLIAEARVIGYHTMRLDTLHTMVPANRLYESLGFRDMPAYCYNPLPEARYMTLALQPPAAERTT